MKTHKKKVNFVEILDQLVQITTVKHDSELMSANATRKLIECGYAYKVNGYNVISENGIIVLKNLGIL